MKKYFILAFNLIFVCLFVFSQDKIKIGLIRQVEVKPFFDFTDGIMKGLKDLGYDEKNCEFILQPINNKFELIPEIVANFRKANVKLIVPMATQTGIETLKIVKDIPVIYSFADYHESFSENAKKYGFGNNYTGVCNRVPALTVIKMASKIKKIENVGMVYNDKDYNSIKTVEYLISNCKELNIKYTVEPYSEEKNVIDAFKKIVEKNIDCLIYPTETFQAKYLKDIKQIPISKKILTAGMDTIFCDENAAVISISASSFEAGVLTANKIAEFLKGKKINEIKPEDLNKFDVIINLKIAKEMGITIPVDLIRTATKVIKE